MSPSLLKIAQEQSRLSLILGEKEVLVRVTPISSEMEENRFLNTSKRIGLTFKTSSSGKIFYHRDAEDTENIFDLPIETRWEAGVKKMGIDPMLLSDTAGHA